MPPSNDYTLQTGYQPGLIGRVITLFGRAYIEKWKFWKFFECKVAGELSIFMECYDPDVSCIWSIEKEGEIYGSITLDGSHAQQDGAHLRWFILDDKAKGQGLGRLLLQSAIDFARDKGYNSVYLWTLSGLEPAGALYRKFGFKVEEQTRQDQWGVETEEERLRLILSD